MFKKLLGLVLGMVLISGDAWAYTTWQEALDAGLEKYIARNYIGARIDLMEALTLASLGLDKSNAQHAIGITYYEEKNYPQARIEFSKVLLIEDADITHIASSRLHIGLTYYHEKNYVQGREELINVLLMDETPYFQKVTWKELLSIGEDFKYILTKLVIVKGWSGYYYRAKVKQQLKDYAGAKDDLLTAGNLTDDAEATKQIGNLLEKINLQLKQSQ